MTLEFVLRHPQTHQQHWLATNPVSIGPMYCCLLGVCTYTTACTQLVAQPVQIIESTVWSSSFGVVAVLRFVFMTCTDFDIISRRSNCLLDPWFAPSLTVTLRLLRWLLWGHLPTGQCALQSATVWCLPHGFLPSIRLCSGAGVQPNTDFLPPQVVVASDGGVLVDRTMCSSVPDLYAAGDCCTVGFDAECPQWFQMRLWSQVRPLPARVCRNTRHGHASENIWFPGR
jgi:hypothetical protein